MTALNPPSTLEEVLKLLPAQFDSYWKEIDGIVAASPTSSDQITAWEAITLLAVYDRSLAHIFDLEGHTYQSFFRLIQDPSLTRFAIENYFCAEHLIESFHIDGTHISGRDDEYALARAIIGLFGGVLQAILADKLPSFRSHTLGVLIREAQAKEIIRVGTKLAALSSMMLYLRNHIHADRDANRRAYFVDIHVAKGCKVALDWVIADLLQP